jgi:hypothetical protein
LHLGNQIKSCIEKIGRCDFEAELWQKKIIEIINKPIKDMSIEIL